MTLKNSRKPTLFYKNTNKNLPTDHLSLFFLTALPTPQNKNHPVHKTYRRKITITPTKSNNNPKNVFDGTKQLQQQPKL
jgi:hypothetical protein